MNDGIKYVTDKNSKIKWDKLGKNYRIKKGDHVVSLSDLNSSTLCVDFNYSTVKGWKNCTKLITPRVKK